MDRIKSGFQYLIETFIILLTHDNKKTFLFTLNLEVCTCLGTTKHKNVTL